MQGQRQGYNYAPFVPFEGQRWAFNATHACSNPSALYKPFRLWAHVIVLSKCDFKCLHQADEVDHTKLTWSKQIGEVEQVRDNLVNMTLVNTTLAVEMILLRESIDSVNNDVWALQDLLDSRAYMHAGLKCPEEQHSPKRFRRVSALGSSAYDST